MARTNRASPPPLYRDATALCQWLLGHFRQSQDMLARALCDNALRLHEDVVLALRERDLDVRIESADERLIVLRA